MFNINETTGDLTIRQGDSGYYTIIGLPTDQDDYTVYFQAQDEDRKNIGEQLQVATNGNESVVFFFTGNYTNIFTVPVGDTYATYNFLFKLCSKTANTEQTLVLGNKNITDTNILTVYPKVVEGI